MEPYGIALLGCGTVGGGVAKLLLQEPERLAAQAGRPLVLRKVVVKDSTKKRDVAIPLSLITTDYRSVLADPSVQLVVEVVGGTAWARTAVLSALEAGKDVVTANKALLAQHGQEIFDAGRKYGRSIAFEASVAGGIPIIGALTQGLAANRILSIQGILNGTCNYILTEMTDQGRSYHEALADAQAKGYAEADPTMDVDGTDTAHKLAILSQIAFRISIPLSEIPRRGIAEIDKVDIGYAKELGYTIKLLAEAWVDPKSSDGPIAMHVSPVMLRQTYPLAQVRDAFNAIFVTGDAVGATLYYGRGAGQMPTASAVVADIIDMAVGRAQQTFRSLKLWSSETRKTRLRSRDTIPSRFYLRMTVQDRPGVLAEITRILADHHISISSIIQHEAMEGPEGSAVVPLIIMTHTALAGAFTDAVACINRSPSVIGGSVYFPVAD
ncbi:MAG: homoserine dehydrogenase [Gemmataceae bacterium]